MLPLVTSQLIGLTDSWVGIAPVLRGVAAKIDSDSFMEKQSRAWGAKDFPESDECCHLLSSWSEKCSFVFVKKLCSWRWTKYRTYDENIMVSENQKPIHLVTKRPGSCFLSYCKSFLPVQSAGMWKAWNLVTNKISSQTSKVFQSYQSHQSTVTYVYSMQ